MTERPPGLSELAALYGATPQDVEQAARALMVDASTGRSVVRPSGEPLTASTPEFSAVDRWTMLELWARAVPDQYAKLLRAPVVPEHPGQATLLPKPAPRAAATRYDQAANRHRHLATGQFTPPPQASG